MMIIRTAQMDAFKEAAQLTFVTDIVTHLSEFSVPLCKTLGHEQLKSVVLNGIARAENYGLTYRGPIRLFLEMMLIFGSGFDKDPQYPWAGDALRKADFENQMFKAGHLEHLARDYLTQVHGRNSENAEQALRLLEALAGGDTLVFRRASMKEDILDVFCRIFPIKLNHIGTVAAEDLAQRAQALSDKVFGRDQERVVGLLAILMFSFGAECADDPIYPWIGATLRNPRITDPSFRAMSLERKAIKWLKAINARAVKSLA